MAIKINNITVIDDGKNVNAGIVTATSFSGDGSSLTGIGIGTTSNINTTGIITASTLQATSALISPSGISSDRPIEVSPGSIRFNTEYNVPEVYDGTNWREVTLVGVVINPTNVRGVFGGGNPGPSNVIDYITIGSQSNATDFGDLTVSRRELAACSSSTRGVFGGGGPAPTNTIDYITIASESNATDFGDLTVARFQLAACSSSTRGVFGGGSATNTIDYITIASESNATDFGDLTGTTSQGAACSSSTRGVFGGVGPGTTNRIDYITIASGSLAADFGDLTVAREALAACSSSTRGVFGGGNNPSPLPGVTFNTIDYITITSQSDAIDFGDLTVGRSFLAACSSPTRGVFGGGGFPGISVIDYITIASQSNATDFGDLTVSRGDLAACSNGHGGL